MSNQDDSNFINDECLNDDKKNVKFFEITGRTLVHPMTYHMQEFQKNIIITAVFNNTLISLPSGLGKNFLAAVITFNFHRWFLNSKIVILSQTRSYLTDQIAAYGSYTTLSDEMYAELSPSILDKDCTTALKKPIVLTSPQKMLNCLNNNLCGVSNLILLIVFETAKISKCKEYKEIMNKITNCELRILVFLDPVGFNSKSLKQVVNAFNISKIEIINTNSPDIKKCTFSSDIESVAIDISPHIVSIKDSFYSVFEKYGKKLKDTKVINGNVASLTKAQIQKWKEKFLKDPPQSMQKAEKDDIVNSMTMCSFLCYGIELLHNWGIRVFYNYLFDDKKDDELKLLIANDEHLTNQMKLLNEYLKNNVLKSGLNLTRIIHPKLLYLKNTIVRYFSDTETNIENVRILVLCSVDDVIDDIDRTFRELPEYIRYYCIKTKAKNLASVPEHKEVIQNFLNGIISVLVISNMVDEILEIRTSLIISLDPYRSLFKLSDARFHEGARKCMFILTKGTEYNKFETILNEKRNEQKPLDVSGIDDILQESPALFPKEFNPEFECTSIKEPKRSFKNSPGQKTLLDFLKPKSTSSTSSSPVTSKSGRNSCNRKTTKTKYFNGADSPSLFAEDFDFSNNSVKNGLLDQFQDSFVYFDYNDDDPIQPLPNAFNRHVTVALDTKIDEYDSFDDLILDLPGDIYNSKNNNVTSFKVRNKENDPFPGLLKKQSKFSWTKKLRDKPAARVISEYKQCEPNGSKKHGIGLAELPNESFVDSLFEDSSDSDNIDDNGGRKSEEVVAGSDRENGHKSDTSVSNVQDSNFSDPLLPNNTPQPKSECDIIAAASDILREDATSDHELFSDNDWDVDFIEKDSNGVVTNSNPSPPFNSNRFEPSLNAATRNINLNVKEFSCVPKSDLSPAKYRMGCDLFPQSIISYSGITRRLSSSTDDIVRDSFAECSDWKRINGDILNNTEKHSFTEIPSAMLSDFVPESQSRRWCSESMAEKTKISLKPTSPVLFSSKKSNRKRLSSNSHNSSFKFDSFFEFSEENLRHIDDLASSGSKTTNDVKQSTPIRPAATCEFESALFDDNDDIFVNDITKSNKISSSEKNSSRRVNGSHLKNEFKACTSFGSAKKVKSMTSNPVRNSFVCDRDSDRRMLYFGKYSRPSDTNSAKTSTPINGRISYATFDNINATQSSTPTNIRIIRGTPETKTNSPITGRTSIDTLNKMNETQPSTPNNNRSIDSINSANKITPTNIRTIDSTPHILNTVDHTSENKFTKNLSRKSIPLFEDSEIVFDSSDSKLSKSLDKTTTPPDAGIKRGLFANFTKILRQKLLLNENADIKKQSSPVNELHRENTNGDDDADDFPWLKNSSPVGDCFKKPQSLMKSGSVSCHTIPSFSSLDGVGLEITSPTPDKLKKQRTKKSGKLKRKLVEQFIDAEAEVTDDDENSSVEGCSQLSDDSFIDDEACVKPANMTNYLNSLKSPQNRAGKFHIPVLSESKLKINVFSQVEEYEQTYENDSFCVDEDELEPEAMCIPSVLTQMEERLNKRKMVKLKPKPFKRIKVIEDSSPDSPDTRVKMRKRIKYFSSDSDED